MTWHGIKTVARQEFTLRIRAGRWRWLLGLWFTLVSGFTLLVHFAVNKTSGQSSHKGVVVYGALVLFVLALALLVVPSLTGQSVNGDRERGTLATLQVTRLTAWEITLGKLAAGWGTAATFLALSVPAIAYATALGGVPVGRLIVVTTIVLLLLGVVSALALCLSAVLARTTTSAVLSYLLVFTLTLGTLITFAIGTGLTTERYTETIQCPTRQELLDGGAPVEEIDQIVASCTSESYPSRRTRTDRTWWLLAPNPFVILADAAPALPELTKEEEAERERLARQGIQTDNLRDSDPLGGIGRQVRALREPPRASGEYTDEEPPRRAVWPYGLAFDLLLAGGALVVTSRRLQAPSRRLGKGQRIA